MQPSNNKSNKSDEDFPRREQSGVGFGMREFSSDRVSELRTKLAVPLRQHEIATRPAGGKRLVSYLETHKSLEKAQDIFGFDFSTEIKSEPKIIFQQAKKVMMQCVVRVVLSNGSYHEDLGIGTSHLPDFSESLKIAAKASVSDAIKRALQHFGPALGSCLRDKEFVASVETKTTTAMPSSMRTTPLQQQPCRCDRQVSQKESHKRHKSFNVVITPPFASGDQSVITTTIQTATVPMSRDSDSRYQEAYDKFFAEYPDLKEI